MTVNIGTDANIDQERLKQQMAHPSSPASGYELLYIISGSPHGGLFLKDSSGRQIGPFITGTPTSAPSSISVPTIYQIQCTGTAVSSFLLNPAPIAGHSLILVLDGFNTGQATNVSSTNTTWTQINTFDTGGGQKASIWIGVCAGSPGTTVTITHPNAFMSLTAIEIGDTLAPTLVQAANSYSGIVGLENVTLGHLIIASCGTDNTAVYDSLFLTGVIPVGIGIQIVPVMIGYAVSDKVWANGGSNAAALMICEVT